MKNYIQYIPLTAFAAATMLGSTLSATETISGRNRTGGQQYQSQQSDEASNPQARSKALKVSDLLGMNIDTHNDEKIGEIDEIFINTQSGEVLAIVVSTGGFLGMGQQQTLISPKDLHFNHDRTQLQTDLSKDQIGTAPRYQKGETTGMDLVRPLGKTALDRENRPGNRTENRQNESNRSMTGQERAERSNRNENRHNDSNRASADQARSPHMTRNAHVQAHSRGLAVSDLIGMSVENHQGESVGNVDELLIDHDKSEVVGVVISTGGFLGMGDRKTLFGLQEMSINTEDEKVILDYNRDQIGRFPEYKDDDQSVFDNLRDRMKRLDPRTDRANTRTEARDNRSQARDDTNNDREDIQLSTDTKSHTSTRNPGRLTDMTVFDQGNSTEELDMTASIRKSIRDNNGLSRRANNVTIISNDGKVVLRGEVDSETEKTTVEGLAHNKAGRANVNSELTVRSR